MLFIEDDIVEVLLNGESKSGINIEDSLSYSSRVGVENMPFIWRLSVGLNIRLTNRA